MLELCKQNAQVNDDNELAQLIEDKITAVTENTNEQRRNFMVPEVSSDGCRVSDLQERKLEIQV